MFGVGTKLAAMLLLGVLAACEGNSHFHPEAPLRPFMLLRQLASPVFQTPPPLKQVATPFQMYAEACPCV